VSDLVATGGAVRDTVVILANSIKHRLRCVAGKSLTTGQWVRLVADAEGEAITEEQAKYDNVYGRYLARPLQKISMDLNTAVPLRHQPENYLCEPNWRQNYKLELADLPNLADHPVSLWGEGGRVSADLILENHLHIEQSLYLVQVTGLELYRTDDNKRRIHFRYNNVEYDLPCTCTDFDKILDGEMEHHDYVVVSLGEDHQGHHYKIAATIL